MTFRLDLEYAAEELYKELSKPLTTESFHKILDILKSLRVGATAFNKPSLKKAVEKTLAKFLNFIPETMDLMVYAIYDLADQISEEASRIIAPLLFPVKSPNRQMLFAKYLLPSYL